MKPAAPVTRIVIGRATLEETLDRGGQLGEVVDHRVGAEVMRRDRAVAIGRDDGRDASPLRGIDVGRAVPHHDRALRRRTERRQRRPDMAGMGLDPGHRVAGQHRLDVAVDLEVREQASGRALSPVGADGEREAGVAQALDRRLHGGEELHPVGLDFEVVGDEPLDQGPERRVVGPLRALRIEGREEEALGARARALAKALEGDRRVAELRQQPVERRDEIGRGVEERPVEVDEHRVHMLTHHADGAGTRAC